MGKAQRRFGKELEAEAVRLVETSGQTARDCQDLGIGLSTLRRWIDKRRERDLEAPPPERQQDMMTGLCQTNFGAPPVMIVWGMTNPFRYFNSSPEVIRLVVMMSVRYPLSLRNVEDLLAERGLDISCKTLRFWWNRFGPMFAAEIRKKRVARMGGYPQWRWHVDEV
jgi:hypothetical protein